MAEIHVATGCFHELGTDLAGAVDAIVEAGGDGIELTLATPAEARELDLDRAAEITADVPVNSIHAPFRVEFDPGAASRDLLDRVEEIRARLGADVAVFHPDRAASLGLLREHTAPAVENMQRRKGFDRSDLRAFVDDAVPVVVDTCHALTWDADEPRALLDAYAGRISHVHLSAYDAADDRSHALLVENDVLDAGTWERLQGETIVVENRLEEPRDLRREVAHVREQLEAV